jgi:hypothetical protein
MTELSYEELHAIKLMKEKEHIAAKNITPNGNAVIQRLLASGHCIKKVIGRWYWKKEVYETTLEGSMFLSQYALLIGTLRHEIARATQEMSKVKSSLRTITEEILKANNMNLLSFLTLEMLLKSEVLDDYPIGELQFQHIKVHLSQYSKDIRVQAKDHPASYDLSYLEENDYNSSDLAYELLYWGMVLSGYRNYVEEVNPEAIPQECDNYADTKVAEHVSESNIDTTNEISSNSVTEVISPIESTNSDSSSSYSSDSSYSSSDSSYSSDSGSSNSD